MSSTEATQAFLGYKERFGIPENSLGLTGYDHTGLGVRDPLEAGKFVEQVLGGVEIYRAGFSEADIALGRPKHIMYFIGTAMLELAVQPDETGLPKANTINNQPHWAFGATAEGLLKFADHLRAEGVPFDGPRSHKGTSVVSVYFRDPDGNNLEVCTWEDVPADKVTPMGGPHGFVTWSELVNDWKPRD